MFRRKKQGTLVLSPHFDDAALSVGGSLAARLFPKPVWIFTVFGVSNYTQSRFHIDSSWVTSVRRCEERRYATALGLFHGSAKFKEAGLRIGSTFESIFRGPGTLNPRKPAHFDRVIEHVIRGYDPRFVLCPAGIGNHWDHLLLCEAGRRIKLEPDLTVLFYEDLPYANDIGPKGTKRFVASLDHELRPITIPIDWSRKRDGLMYYPSQIGEDEVRRVHNYTAALAKANGTKSAGERFWTKAPKPRVIK
jgi:LmbE family N-acetylglucosaminyl deacetylase